MFLSPWPLAHLQRWFGSQILFSVFVSESAKLNQAGSKKAAAKSNIVSTEPVYLFVCFFSIVASALN